MQSLISPQFATYTVRQSIRKISYQHFYSSCLHVHLIFGPLLNQDKLQIKFALCSSLLIFLLSKAIEIRNIMQTQISIVFFHSCLRIFIRYFKFKFCSSPLMFCWIMTLQIQFSTLFLLTNYVWCLHSVLTYTFFFW